MRSSVNASYSLRATLTRTVSRRRCEHTEQAADGIAQIGERRPGRGRELLADDLPAQLLGRLAGRGDVADGDVEHGVPGHRTTGRDHAAERDVAARQCGDA